MREPGRLEMDVLGAVAVDDVAAASAAAAIESGLTSMTTNSVPGVLELGRDAAADAAEAADDRCGRAAG